MFIEFSITMKTKTVSTTFEVYFRSELNYSVISQKSNKNKTDCLYGPWSIEYFIMFVAACYCLGQIASIHYSRDVRI